MRAILLWFFSKTKLGKLVDGNKTIIGFSLAALSYLLKAVVVILGAGASTFPEIAIFSAVQAPLAQLSIAIGDSLEALGLGVMTIGVAHDKAKRPGS